jgi:serine/threonine protein kinase
LNKKKDKEKDEENNDDNPDHILFENEDSEEDEDDDMPTTKRVNLIMSKIHGVTENLYNNINKRISSILERCKVPIIKIEDYMFDKKLGEGGYAVIFSVYKVNDEDCKEYAMKKIIARSLDEIDKFTKEFELVYSCVHPNIMKIYGIGINMLDQTTYSLYVLMEKAKRDWDADIKRHLKKKQSYTEKELINILRQLANALLFMQQNLKISHRDIKPQNVLLFENGIYKIADFGEAKEIKISKDVNTLRGTELYMSPALYYGLQHEMHDVTHDPYKSDVFSLGFCFLYAAALNFQLLYQVRNVSSTNQINNVLKQQLKKKYSDTFINILSNMMEIDESKRYDFTQLIDAINTHYDKDGNLKKA